jgi:hypothetical protein
MSSSQNPANNNGRTAADSSSLFDDDAAAGPSVRMPGAGPSVRMPGAGPSVRMPPRTVTSGGMTGNDVLADPFPSLESMDIDIDINIDEALEPEQPPETSQGVPQEQQNEEVPEEQHDEEMPDVPVPERNAPRKRKAVDPASVVEDEDMEDTKPRREEKFVTFTQVDAPKAVQEEMKRLDPSHYPDKFEIGIMGGGEGTLVEVPMADIFELRGSDTNKRFLPADLAKGGRARTMVELSVGTAGRHLEMSLAEAKKRDEEQPPAPPQQVKGKGKGKSTPAPAPVKPSAPPADECVKAKFHLATQTPHIEITTIDPDTSNILSTRIWAYEFAWSPSEPWIGLSIKRVEPETDPEILKQHESWLLDINKMAALKNTAVVRAEIMLKEKRQRTWAGISESSLAAIRANPEYNKVRDLLIVGLDSEDQFALNFSNSASKGSLAKWTQKLDGYFRNLLMVAKEYGNFWFWRRQTELSGEGQDAIERPEMPKATDITPRFLGTQWSAIQVTEPDRTIHYEKLALHKWSPLEFPESYEDVNEAAFLLKLAAKQESETQRRNLQQLFQSDCTKFFQGRFHCVNKSPWQYSVEVYLGLTTTVAEANIRIPAPGTRIEIFIDKNNAKPPRKADMLKLRGQVVFDATETDATFVCVVDSSRPFQCDDTGTDYSLYIDYIVEDLPYERQLKAISELQIPNKDHKGPDGLSIIFNCDKTTSDTDILKKNTSPADLANFLKTLRCDFAHPPNQVQEAAAIHTTTSDGGSTVIIGPPGTGKTTTVLQVARAHAKLGRRVMLTAPTNAAVGNLVDVFNKHNGSLPENQRVAPHQWVYFTGAHSSLAASSKLKHRQSQEEMELMERNNAYLGHLRDAEIRKKAPRYEQTFGYKLLQRMAYWLAIPEADGEVDKLHTWSVEFDELAMKLPYITDQDEKQRAKTHLASLKYALSLAYFKQVSFCFCTLSTSAHGMMLESGHWDEVIIDDAARETRAGIATVIEAFRGRASHFTWSGDAAQGEVIIIGSDSNVGHQFLARNVFAEVADIKIKNLEQAIALDVFTLDTCYRMSRKLIDWSSKYCYGGVVKSAPSASRYNHPLRNTLKAYWAARTRETFSGKYDEIAIDINSKSEMLEGSTTMVNTTEAIEVAWLVKDMLLFDPPASTAQVPTVRIRPENFIIISNYVGQVSAIRKALRQTFKGQENLKREDIDALNPALGTTSVVQGREEDIAIYSLCIGNGKTRLKANEKLGLGFVAYLKNYNVSTTRQRVARHVVGSLKLFVQALKDRHPITHRHREFFQDIDRLYQSGFVLSSEECAVWRETRQKPTADDAFGRKIVGLTTFSGGSACRYQSAALRGPRNE